MTATNGPSVDLWPTWWHTPRPYLIGEFFGTDVAAAHASQWPEPLASAVIAHDIEAIDKALKHVTYMTDDDEFGFAAPSGLQVGLGPCKVVNRTWAQYTDREGFRPEREYVEVPGRWRVKGTERSLIAYADGTARVYLDERLVKFIGLGSHVWASSNPYRSVAVFDAERVEDVQRFAACINSREFLIEEVR
jgi:hypothetical protein